MARPPWIPRLAGYGGFLGALIVFTGVAMSWAGGYKELLMPGEMVSAHASFGKDDCAACHQQGDAVQPAACLACHAEDLPAPHNDETKDREDCGQCHREHRGTLALVRHVRNDRCSTCHEFPSLVEHPEIKMFGKPLTENPAITFPHDKHIKVRCQKCHDVEGRGFAPRKFEPDCSGGECHDFEKHPDDEMLQHKRKWKKCRSCHPITKDNRVIPPYTPLGRVLPKVEFSHEPHMVAPCRRCHANANEATVAGTVSLPSIEVCAMCHRRGRVNNKCAQCHVFHPRAVTVLPTQPSMRGIDPPEPNDDSVDGLDKTDP